MKLSNSRYHCYLECPYKHWLRYYRKLRTKNVVRPLTFGSDMHKLLQFRGDQEALSVAQKEIGEAYYDLTPTQQNILGEDYLLELSAVFEDYKRVYRKFRMPNHTEREFKIRVGEYRGEKIVFHGIVDEDYLSREDGKKVIEICDHKTFNRRPEMDTLVMNTQKCLYAKAYFLKSGILPARVIWDYIKSTPAAFPAYLEHSQRFSRAASKTITPYSYLRACDYYGITDKAIRAEAKRYKGNIPEFFFRVTMDIVPEAVDIVWDSFLYVARDIIRQGHKNKVRKLDRNCAWCDYRDICNMELAGHSAEGVIERNYTIRDDDEEKV